MLVFDVTFKFISARVSCGAVRTRDGEAHVFLLHVALHVPFGFPGELTIQALPGLVATLILVLGHLLRHHIVQLLNQTCTSFILGHFKGLKKLKF